MIKIQYAYSDFQPVDVRFIEYMPFDGNRWNFKRMVSYQQMLDTIRDKWPDLERLSDHPNDTSKVIHFTGFYSNICYKLSYRLHYCLLDEGSKTTTNH